MKTVSVVLLLVFASPAFADNLPPAPTPAPQQVVPTDQNPTARNDKKAAMPNQMDDRVRPQRLVPSKPGPDSKVGPGIG